MTHRLHAFVPATALAAAALVVAAFVIALSPPGFAQERIGADRYAITLRNADLHPATPQEARRLRARIEDAALAVCGATPASLREVKLAVRRSACWHDSVADAMARVSAPALAQAEAAR